MPYYKFLADPKSASYLLRGEIKFTPVAELNDPSELTLNIIEEDVRSSLERLRRDGYSDEEFDALRKQGALLQRLVPIFQWVPLPETKAEATELLRWPIYDQVSAATGFLEKITADLTKTVGLFCLSKRFDSFPMWAHYAANATGVVVELEGLDQVFRGDETGVLNHPISVGYDRESTGMTFDPDSHRSLFFEKFQDWSYEREVRVVLPLADCEQRDWNGKALFIHQIPSRCISRLILGWRIGPDDAAEIRRRASDFGVAVSQARFNKGKVVLE